MDNYFSVGVGIEAVSALFEIGTQLWKVVNLAVEDHPDGSILVEHWLVASRQVDDTEAAHSQPSAVFDEDSFVIRSAVHDGLAHAVDCAGLNPVVGRRAHDTSNSTHAL